MKITKTLIKVGQDKKIYGNIYGTC